MARMIFCPGCGWFEFQKRKKFQDLLLISTPTPDTEDKKRPGVDSVDEWWVNARKNSETGENEVSFRLEATIKTNACLSQSFFEQVRAIFRTEASRCALNLQYSKH
jgi:hypothetical protein